MMRTKRVSNHTWTARLPAPLVCHPVPGHFDSFQFCDFHSTACSSSGSADALLNQLEEETELGIGDIRRLVYNLRPPALDELGFVGAIREYVAKFGSEEQAHNAALKVTVEAPEALPLLPAAVEVAAYRIVQEAVTNVIRHAHAQSCRVRFFIEDALQIEVSDNGKGIEEADRAGVGLTSMRERAKELGGTFAIKKTVPHGTQITACLPLSDVVRASSRL